MTVIALTTNLYYVLLYSSKPVTVASPSLILALRQQHSGD